MPTDTYEPRFSQTPFSAEDIARIMTCRGEHNRLGFAYQLAFVQSLNRYPAQDLLEIDEGVLTFASLQLRMDIQNGWQYGGRQKTVSEHQDAIRGYLDLRSFSSATTEIGVWGATERKTRFSSCGVRFANVTAGIGALFRCEKLDWHRNIALNSLRKRSFVQRLTEYRQIKRCALHKYIAK
jgi:hypothetical protein